MPHSWTIKIHATVHDAWQGMRHCHFLWYLCTWNQQNSTRQKAVDAENKRLLQHKGSLGHRSAIASFIPVHAPTRTPTEWYPGATGRFLHASPAQCTTLSVNTGRQVVSEVSRFMFCVLSLLCWNPGAKHKSMVEIVPRSLQAYQEYFFYTQFTFTCIMFQTKLSDNRQSFVILVLCNSRTIHVFPFLGGTVKIPFGFLRDFKWTTILMLPFVLWAKSAPNKQITSHWQSAFCKQQGKCPL